MKLKLFLISGIVLSMIFSLSGCLNGEELEEPLSREYETYNGEFMSLGSIKVNQIVTHLFETDDGDILYAYSDRYDLDKDEYFNNRVKAYGLVMEYENLEKDLFEVRRITEAGEIAEENEEVKDVDYKDTDLGVSFTYPDNWDLTALRDGIRLEAPLPKYDDQSVEDKEAGDQDSDQDDEEAGDQDGDQDDEEESAGENSDEQESAGENPEDEEAGEKQTEPDYVIISNTGSVLETNSEDEDNTRVADIKSYASGNYPHFVGLSAETSYIGTDKQLAVEYKTDSGDTTYFVPRGAELFELSYVHPSVAEGEKLKNGNIFSEIVNSFRFLPYGEDISNDEQKKEESSGGEDSRNEDPGEENKDKQGSSNEENTYEEESPDEEESAGENSEDEEENYDDSSMDDLSMVEVDSYRQFESNPYNFKISYPSNWYYAGGSGGYDFDDKPVENENDSIIRLDLNVRSSENESATEVTVLVDGTYYTLSGPAEYADVMSHMANSIASVENDE